MQTSWCRHLRYANEQSTHHFWLCARHYCVYTEEVSANNMSDEFASTSLRHYKLSRAYQLLDANHICNVLFNELKQSYNIYAVKASCIPSQSGDEAKIKHLHVILDKQTGEPYGGFCTCTVGLVYYWKKQLCLENIKISI